jgi:hypothetical protein
MSQRNTRVNYSIEHNELNNSKEAISQPIWYKAMEEELGAMKKKVEIS